MQQAGETERKQRETGRDDDKNGDRNVLRKHWDD
jgi:hypothetical protein